MPRKAIDVPGATAVGPYSHAVEHEGLSVVCSPSAETNFDIKGLTRSDGRRLAFSAALHERIGLLLYGWRGWLAKSPAES